MGLIWCCVIGLAIVVLWVVRVWWFFGCGFTCLICVGRVCCGRVLLAASLWV